MGEIILKNICKKYDNKVILDNVDFSIEEGSFFTFLGASGCGKTTLLRIIAGFVKSEEGRVFLGNKDITNLRPEDREIGMVFQNYALFPNLNVYENIAYGLKIKKLKKKEIEEKVNKYLDLVNLKGYDKKIVSELSGGEQQRVALARTLATEPKVLLLDEPLSNLDAKLREKMRIEIKDIQKKLGITTIFVTHDQTEALTMSDKIAVFNNGRCVQIGSPKEIYMNPCNSFIASFIGDTNLFKVGVYNNKAIINNNFKLEVNRNSLGKYISIKSEDIRISKEKINSDINVFEGDIEKILYNGVSTQYIVNVMGEKIKANRINNIYDEFNAEVKEKVFLEIPIRAIIVLEN
ncbi:ABC transporter ATP-binding protein [Clostridium sp. Sa3CUN1]|uniref:ABC transporter ATP-binding protein n=1 Tax=Clostridium gallinarum TaxID=2762246 RepID=A0ABR8Q4M1_9CLOT|nr:ABC transporter ATP-binding protein [Clostridium gallinarum]MBD7915379.1 ABC transporter ATP-binding protein [Clostridium gallinarum]